MAEAFNLNTFLSEQQTYTQRKYTNAENAQAAMEARDVERAEEAVANNGLLSLTVGEKLKEMGIGERVIQQLGDTAKGMVEGVVSPFTDWLEKYENIFDERVYNAEMQALGKQHFFNNKALAKQSLENPTGQNFSMNM
ncbi:MAG: hypothetical protein MJ231_04445 [bacterium]|nr:hypothetical protein [bacterium]